MIYSDVVPTQHAADVQGRTKQARHGLMPSVLGGMYQRFQIYTIWANEAMVLHSLLKTYLPWE